MKSHTISDIAKDHDTSERTVKQWIKNGELRAVNVSRDRNSRKPRLRVLDSDLQAFLDSRAVEPEQQASGACSRRQRRKPPKQFV